MVQVKICDTITCGSVLASGAQTPASVMKLFPVVFGAKFYCLGRTEPGEKPDRVNYGGSTLPKNNNKVKSGFMTFLGL